MDYFGKNSPTEEENWRNMFCASIH